MFSFFKKEKKAVFIDWLKKNKYYDKFIEISDLEKLSLETDPKYFFYYVDWFELEKNKKEEVIYWEKALFKWLSFINNKTVVTSGFEKNIDKEIK